jgi:uroporphyrinogen decarboxylase
MDMEWAKDGFSGELYIVQARPETVQSQKDFSKLKALMFQDPEAFDALMKILSDAVADYLEMQIAVSATAVQLFDTWAGQLAPEDFEHFVLPSVKKIVDRVRATGTPVIYYINGIGNLLEIVRETGADVIGIDWRIDISEARKRLGPNQSIQGNLDPAVLFAPETVITEKVFQMLDKSGGRGLIVNLGHGLMPGIGLSAVETFVSSVRNWAENRR